MPKKYKVVKEENSETEEQNVVDNDEKSEKNSTENEKNPTNEDSEIMKILHKINNYITETPINPNVEGIEVPVIPDTPELVEEEEVFQDEAVIEEEPLTEKLKRLWNRIYYG